MVGEVVAVPAQPAPATMPPARAVDSASELSVAVAEIVKLLLPETLPSRIAVVEPLASAVDRLPPMATAPTATP